VFLIFNAPTARQIISGHRGRIGDDLFWRAFGHHLPPMHPCSRSNVEHIIRLANSLFVMLNDDDGISLIAKVFERGQKPVIIPLVQADAWLIQHIKHALKPGADLAGQANPLALATRKRARITRQGQIFEPDIVEKPNANYLAMARRVSVLAAPQMARQNQILFTKSAKL